ncbi:MAG: DUF4136 domain-containing protein [bacterium]|nr:DUF4136 domain-containing protein [bacterium]
MRSTVLPLMILVVLLAGCSGKDKEIQRILDSPIDYTSHVSPHAEFKRYGTWDWVPVPKGLQSDPRASDPDLRARIEEAVTKQMDIRGYRKTRNASDMMVNYHVAFQRIDKDYMKQLYDGKYLPAYRMDFKGSGKAKGEWEEGSIIVFVFETKTQELIWQSSAKAEITGGQAPDDKAVTRLNNAILNMFSSLPGRPEWESSGK